MRAEVTKMKKLMKSAVIACAIFGAVVLPQSAFAQKIPPRVDPDCVNWSVSGGCLVSIDCSAENGMWQCDYYDKDGYWLQTVSGRY